MTQGKKGRSLDDKALDIIRRNPGIEREQLRLRLGAQNNVLQRSLDALWEAKAIELVGDLEFKHNPRVYLYVRGAEIKPLQPLFQGKPASSAPVKTWIDPTYKGTWKQPDHVPLVFSPDWQDGHWRRKREQAS